MSHNARRVPWANPWCQSGYEETSPGGMKKGRGMARLTRRGQTGYSQPIPKAGIGGSPRFAARTPIGIFDREFSLTEQERAGLRWHADGGCLNANCAGGYRGGQLDGHLV